MLRTADTGDLFSVPMGDLGLATVDYLGRETLLNPMKLRYETRRSQIVPQV